MYSSTTSTLFCLLPCRAPRLQIITMSHQKIAPYNFFKGHPSTKLLPTKELLEATQRVLTRFQGTQDNYDGFHDTHPLNYGPDLGNLEVRQLIAQWNDKNFGLSAPSDPDCINLTSGASYGVMNILAQVTFPRDNVTRQAFLISPTYFLINAAFIDAGFAGKLSGITEMDDGQIDFDEFETKLKNFESVAKIKSEITKDDIKPIYDPYRPIKKIYRYVLYVVPTFSNPKGGSLTIENRKKLIELARKYNILIISDDVYDLLDYRGPDVEHYPRLVHLDRETLPKGEKFGNVISNATFSKLLGPGIRAGFQETATPELAFLLSQGGAHKSGGTPSHLNTVIIGELLKSGEVDKFIAKLNSVYSERANAIREAIKKYLPRGSKVSAVEGGYFVWVTLPSEYHSLEIAKECESKGVILATGDNFEVTGDEKSWGKSGVRLSISHLDSDKIAEGIKIWGDVCQKYKH